LHVFGFKDSDFPYYYDINNGLPRTPRPIQQVEHDCNDGSRRSIFAASEETVKRGLTSYGVNYYEITTPRVKQVARNQFDCQEMDGARLENQPTGRSCLGDHWEEVRKSSKLNFILQNRMTNTSIKKFWSKATFF